MRSMLDSMSAVAMRLRTAVPERERPARLVCVVQEKDGSATARVRSRRAPYREREYRIAPDFSVSEVVRVSHYNMKNSPPA